MLQSEFISDISPYTFRPAFSSEDWDAVGKMRNEGYAKYIGKGFVPRDSYDEYALVFIVKDAVGNYLGTCRIIPRQKGKVELEEYPRLSSLLENPGSMRDVSSLVELSRFTVPMVRVLDAGARMAVRYGLYKTMYSFCVKNGYHRIIIACRKGLVEEYTNVGLIQIVDEDYSPIRYKNLGFREHFLMVGETREMKLKHQAIDPLLYRFFHETEHPNIVLK